MILKLDLSPLSLGNLDQSDVFHLFVLLYQYYEDRQDLVTAHAIRNLVRDVTGLDVLTLYSDQVDSSGKLIQ